jgi:SAM-dependent methyltransferase
MVYISLLDDGRALIVDGPVSIARGSPLLTSTRLADVQDSLEFRYLDRHEAEQPARRRNTLDALHRLEPYLDRDSATRRLLDFGSGLGFFLSVAKEQGWQTLGLEPRPASAIYTRAKFGIDVITDTLQADTLPPDHFDVITSFQVFEHLLEPAIDLQRLRAALKANGLILIEVPNFETWSMKLQRARHRHFVGDHVNFFSAQTLGALLNRSGFSVVSVYQPTRYMTVRYLIERWGWRVLPQSINRLVRASTQRLHEKMLRLNVGDILAVIARKL